MKKIIEIVAIVLIVGVIGYIFITRNNEEKEVIKYVNENYIQLEEVVRNNASYDNKYIKKVEEKNDLVIFYVKDKVGFYYSKDDQVKTIDGHTNLLGLGDNKYSWDNGTIIKVRDKWYYFKLK